MSDNDEVLDEFANLSLLLLTWILDHQDEPAPQQREAASPDPAAYDAARALSGHLLRRAESRGAQLLPSASALQEKFASLIGAGARTAENGEYHLETTRKQNCVVGVGNPKPGVCLIKDRPPDGDTDQLL